MSYSEKFKNKTTPTLIQFYADWCAPCRMLSPVVKEFADKYGDKITVEQINVDHNQDIATEFGVRNIPTMFLLKEETVLWQNIGYMPITKLTSEIEEASSISLEL